MKEKPSIMNGSVIIVDDDKDILELLTEYLLLEDFDVVGRGTDGLMAVNLYAEHRPDFVIMDIALPNYDGLYGLEKIKKLNPDAIVTLEQMAAEEQYTVKQIVEKLVELRPASRTGK